MSGVIASGAALVAGAAVTFSRWAFNDNGLGLLDVDRSLGFLDVQQSLGALGARRRAPTRSTKSTARPATSKSMSRRAKTSSAQIKTSRKARRAKKILDWAYAHGYSGVDNDSNAISGTCYYWIYGAGQLARGYLAGHASTYDSMIEFYNYARACA